MEKIKKYFEENGFLYGVSSKFDFGRWKYWVYKFESLEEAEKWLHTETYDFRERELMTKSEAEKLAGKTAVKEAVDYSYI